MMNALEKLFKAIEQEVVTSRDKHGEFNSCHEGWAVILEEVDELWEEVKKKPKNRNKKKMQAEAIQIASTAVRYAMECCKK